MSSDLSEFVDARVGPRGSLENLSQGEIDQLLDTGQGGLYPLFRRCALAVLNSGGAHRQRQGDLRPLPRLRIRIVRHPWGVKLEMQNAPAGAFVDGQMIRGIKEHLFAVLRDVVFIANEIIERRPLRPHRLRRDHQRGIPRAAQRARCSTTRCGRTSWCAGAGTRSTPTSTSTPRTSATSSACAAWTSAPAAARGR